MFLYLADIWQEIQKSGGNLGETNLLSSFFHSNAHVFEFPANYQHKTQIYAVCNNGIF